MDRNTAWIQPKRGGGELTTISNFIRHPPSFGSHQSFSHHLSFHQVPNAEIQGKIDWVRVPEAKTAEKVSAMSEFSTLTSRLPSQLTNYWPTTPPATVEICCQIQLIIISTLYFASQTAPKPNLNFSLKSAQLCHIRHSFMKFSFKQISSRVHFLHPTSLAMKQYLL